MADLRNNIESLRERLYLLLKNRELTDIRVVICSQELDKLLVQYEKRNAIVSRYDKDDYAKIKEADRFISKKLYGFKKTYK